MENKKMNLAGLFGSSSRLQILILLSKKESYLKEIEMELDLYQSATQLHLKSMIKEGILVSKIKGKKRYYGFNRKYLLYKELKNLFIKASKYVKLRSPKDKYKRFHRIPKKWAVKRRAKT